MMLRKRQIALSVAAVLAAATPVFAQTATAPSGTPTAGALNQSQHMQTIEGNVKMYDPSTRMLTLDDGSTWTLPASGGGSQVPVGNTQFITGQKVKVNYFDVNGQKVVASITPSAEGADTGSGK
jgi:hypothetical protein